MKQGATTADGILTVADVMWARERIRGRVVRTPLVAPGARQR